MLSALLLTLVLATAPTPTRGDFIMGNPHSDEGMRQQNISAHFCNWIRVDDFGEGPLLSQARAVRLRIHEAWVTSRPGQPIPGSMIEGRVLVIGPAEAGDGLRTMLTDLRHGAEIRVAIRADLARPVTRLWEEVSPEAQVQLRVRVEALDD
jgi:hypothetical protein